MKRTKPVNPTNPAAITTPKRAKGKKGVLGGTLPLRVELKELNRDTKKPKYAMTIIIGTIMAIMLAAKPSFLPDSSDKHISERYKQRFMDKLFDY